MRPTRCEGALGTGGGGPFIRAWGGSHSFYLIEDGTRDRRIKSAARRVAHFAAPAASSGPCWLHLYPHIALWIVENTLMPLGRKGSCRIQVGMPRASSTRQETRQNSSVAKGDMAPVGPAVMVWPFLNATSRFAIGKFALHTAICGKRKSFQE